MQIPERPCNTSMTTACTESRSRVRLGSPLSMIEMISPTSMTVTASASTSVNGHSDNGLYVPDMRQKVSAAFQAAKSLIERVKHLIEIRYGDKVGCDLALLCAIVPG